MTNVLACIDASVYWQSVCDHAVWASQRLSTPLVSAPLQFLHVLDRHPETATTRDWSGNIGLDAQDRLLAELADIDQQRSKLAQLRGREILDAAVQRSRANGVEPAEVRLRHGALVDTLTDLEQDVRLFVLGKRGEHADLAKMHLGSQLERAVRAVHRPLLVASRQFKPIGKFLIAFDGSNTIRKGVEMLASSPLLQGLQCHVVTAGTDASAQEQLDWARNTLATAGFDTHIALQPGTADAVISEYVSAHAIDLLVMGAYGHSRIRQLIVGSTTTATIRTCLVPVLLLR
jgi:nucleotide-binding universal stress UspA family protein